MAIKALASSYEPESVFCIEGDRGQITASHLEPDVSDSPDAAITHECIYKLRANTCTLITGQDADIVDLRIKSILMNDSRNNSANNKSHARLVLTTRLKENRVR